MIPHPEKPFLDAGRLDEYGAWIHVKAIDDLVVREDRGFKETGVLDNDPKEVFRKRGSNRRKDFFRLDPGMMGTESHTSVIGIEGTRTLRTLHLSVFCFLF
jgi:hypothetical protein